MKTSVSDALTKPVKYANVWVSVLRILKQKLDSLGDRGIFVKYDKISQANLVCFCRNTG